MDDLGLELEKLKWPEDEGDAPEIQQEPTSEDKAENGIQAPGANMAASLQAFALNWTSPLGSPESSPTQKREQVEKPQEKKNAGAMNTRSDEPQQGICNIYISNLPLWKDDAWLSSTFAPFGPIISAKVMLTRRASDKPYGFVQYTEPAMATAAVAAMNGIEVDGMTLQVKLADRDKHGAGQQPSADLYISNLPLEFGAQEITGIFGRHGPILSLVVLTDEDGNSRGLAVVHYFKQEAAAAAIAQWHGQVLQGHNKPLEVMYAKAKHCRSMGGGKNRKITASKHQASSTSSAPAAAPKSLNNADHKARTDQPRTNSHALGCGNEARPEKRSSASPEWKSSWGYHQGPPGYIAAPGEVWWPGKGVW
jgi:RNA recognition motif-containing protein